MERVIQAPEDKVWVTVTRTLNLGNFESIRIDAGMSQTVAPNQNPIELITDLSDAIFEEVSVNIRRYKKAIKPKKPQKDKFDENDRLD